VDAAAGALGVQIQVFNASTSREIDEAFKALMRERPDALFVGSDSFFSSRRIQLVNLTARHALATSFAQREFADVGGLMTYGTNLADMFRQMGVYTGRILKGAKPADLPVMQSTKFELVINAQTARLLDIAVPSSLLALADEVIE
jgi:putative ABC transport system substrate-binding protein